ncbi:MAG: hypothetical protein Q4C47_06460, partial [Planctomycetia bacterium]|nr:hypothetical protein [Planctomycetia bacterium]
DEAGKQMEVIVRTLLPALSDSTESIRTEAARILAPADLSTWENDDQKRYISAMEEFIAAQKSLSEQPASHVALAIFATQRSDFQTAESEYLTAIAIDPTFFPARSGLAAIYDETDQPRKAEPLIRKTITIERNRMIDAVDWYVEPLDSVDRPVGGEGRFLCIPLMEGRYPSVESDASEVVRARHGFFPFAHATPTQKSSDSAIREQLNFQLAESCYSLGLFLANDEIDGKKRLSEAIEPLAESVRLLPEDLRKRYNYAMCLYLLGNRAEAEIQIRKLRSSAPEDPTYRQLETLIHQMPLPDKSDEPDENVPP